MIIDVIALIGVIIAVIIIGIIGIYCCCKSRNKYKGMSRDASAEPPTAVDAVNIKDKSELRPVQV